MIPIKKAIADGTKTLTISIIIVRLYNKIEKSKINAINKNRVTRMCYPNHRQIVAILLTAQVH